MSAAKISDLIQIQTGYTSYVDLSLELFDDNRNVSRMARYRPITSHRKAFNQMGHALNIKDGRCYLLTGSYGTGKSHLCLMFANYLKTPANEPPMPEFFDHYSSAEPTEANTLRDKRQKGRYLVALCAWGGKEDFDEVVLRAIDAALLREGFGEDFDTHYLQAARKIEQWQHSAQSSQSHFLDAFERELEVSNPGQTVNAFKKRLSEFDYAALEAFKRIHLSITTSRFTHDQADLIKILTTTLSSDRFKAKFAGILVLFDEFGYTMEQGNLSPKAFQRFAQLCGEPPVECAPLVFVGTAHKALTQYAKAYSSENFHTASDRIKEIALTADGVEEIIGAIVVPQKESPHWKTYIVPREDTFDGFVRDCQRLKLFDWLKGPKLRQAVIENIYPMHPLATYALLRLAQDVASNNRSVFTFFSGEVGGGTISGSYGDFVASEPILRGDKLNLYTADRLFDYFGTTLQSDNKELRDIVRDHIKDYENSLRALNEVMASDPMADALFRSDPLVSRLLRLMLIHEVIGVPNRADNIHFGLYCFTEAEKNLLKNLVDALCERNVLYKIKETGVLEFKKSTAFDIDRRIEDFKHDPKNQPQNLVADLTELVPLHPKTDLYLEAKDHNVSYSEDKRLERRLMRVADLETEKVVSGEKKSYFEALEAEIEAEIAKKGEFEGLALYVVCDKAEDISRAKNLCAKNASERIVVGIPKQAVPLSDAILELRALLAIEKSDEKKSFTVQDNAALNARLNGDNNRPGARRALLQLRDRLMSHKEVTWHGKFAAALQVDEHKPYDAANRVMETLYNDGRNRVAHDDYNKLHLKVDKSKSVALKEAVEKLADYTEPLIIDIDFAQQRGDRRYLEKCLLQQGVLVQTKTTGTKLHCEFEGNTDKYKSKLPALAAMVKEIETLGTDSKIQLSEWSKRYRKPPYGQGPVALALCIACLRRRFGDSIRFKMDESAVGDMPMRNFDEILALSDGHYANAFLSYKPLTAAEKKLAIRVHKLFGPSGSAQNQDYTLVEAHNALKQWAANCPPIAKVAKLYDPDKHPHTGGFLEALARLEAKDAHTFLFEELPVAFGLDPGSAINDGTVQALEAELQQEKTTLEGALEAVEGRIFEAVRVIFEVQGSTHSDTLDAIAAWYNGLDSQQRDVHAKHTNDSKQLVVHLKEATDLRETFLTRIPTSADYGLRAVRDWGQDKVEEYIGRLQSGKAHIDANRIKVEAPKMQPVGDYEWPTESGPLSFKDEIEISFETVLPGAKIWVSEGHGDPTNSAATREQLNGKPLKVRESKQIRVAVQDAEGNWSPVQMVNLINANKEFEPAITGLPGMQTATFKFPVNKDSLKVTCRELFKKSLQLGIIAPEELQECIEAALQEAKGSR